jgi:hypothetical protein
MLRRALCFVVRSYRKQQVNETRKRIDGEIGWAKWFVHCLFSCVDRCRSSIGTIAMPLEFLQTRSKLTRVCEDCHKAKIEYNIAVSGEEHTNEA